MSVASSPDMMKTKTVQYACVSSPSSKAKSMEQRAKAGESLGIELGVLSTAYTKEEAEPKYCAAGGRGPSSRGYRPNGSQGGYGMGASGSNGYGPSGGQGAYGMGASGSTGFGHGGQGGYGIGASGSNGFGPSESQGGYGMGGYGGNGYGPSESQEGYGMGGYGGNGYGPSGSQGGYGMGGSSSNGYGPRGSQGGNGIGGSSPIMGGAPEVGALCNDGQTRCNNPEICCPIHRPASDSYFCCRATRGYNGCPSFKFIIENCRRLK